MNKIIVKNILNQFESYFICSVAEIFTSIGVKFIEIECKYLKILAPKISEITFENSKIHATKPYETKCIFLKI